MAEVSHGVFPFGEPVREVKQVDDGRPKQVFVLGVYASAVHACWRMGDKVMVRALAVASEPCIFWDGTGAEEIVRRVQKRVPAGLGELTAADGLNGPSGTALDKSVLDPLRIGRENAWLCDLRPYASLNPNQRVAIERNRDTIHTTMPPADGKWATADRRAQIMAELRRSGARVLVTLGEDTLKHFVHPLGGEWSKLSALPYGQLVPVVLDGLALYLLPLTHPRQIAGLGSHSHEWRDRHAVWEREQASAVAAQISEIR